MHISDWSSDVCSSDLVAMVAEKQIRLRDDRFQDRRRIGLPPVPQAPAPIAVEGHADPGCAGAGDGFERGGGAVGPERRRDARDVKPADRSEDNTSELPSLMRLSYAALSLKKKKSQKHTI